MQHPHHSWLFHMRLPYLSIQQNQIIDNKNSNLNLALILENEKLKNS
uniref:V-type proton ATPase proteolipid subunit n=1 Tax=Rhizophora mucronata TaxID=61149 RepID=A0A2P2KUW9_RHIMU